MVKPHISNNKKVSGTKDATLKPSNYTVSYAWATESEAEDDTKYVSDNKVKITITDGDAWAKVKVTVTPKETGSYGLAEGAVITGEYYVRRADEATNLSKAKVTFYNKAGTQLRSWNITAIPSIRPQETILRRTLSRRTPTQCM